MTLRTILSIGAGLLAVLLLDVLGTGVLMVVNGDLVSNAAAEVLPAPEWVLLDMIVRVMSAVSGGYVAAAIAPRLGLRHAVTVGAIATILGVVFVAAATYPLWYNLVSIGLILPATAMGGAIGAERNRTARRMNRAEPRTA